MGKGHKDPKTDGKKDARKHGHKGRQKGAQHEGEPSLSVAQAMGRSVATTGTAADRTALTEPAEVDSSSLSKKDYEAALKPLQRELIDWAGWIQHTGQRVLVIFEGRDTAGKGGAIGALTSVLNPRQCRVTALPKPSEREQAQWYFQRYVPHLPATGEIALFDRSWYNRAGVEKVMGYAQPEQVEAFLKQAPVFERLLVEDGLVLIKYWLTVDQARQEARFAERLADPMKRWKLSPIDLQARTHYADYGAARDAMLKATHTRQAPWTLVDFNDQRLGRLTLLQDLLQRLPDRTVEAPKLEMPPLKGSLGTERFPAGGLKPIKPWSAD